MNNNYHDIGLKLLNLIAAVSLFIFLNHFSIYLADRFMPVYGDVWLIIHHTIQFMLAVGIMLLPFWNMSLKQWGLNVAHSNNTWSIIRSFTVGWIICTTLFTFVSQLLSGWSPLIEFTLTPFNIISNLFFEFIIVGISEEVVFRGLVLGILLKRFHTNIRISNFSISSAGLITVVLFAMAHIGFTLSPFQITHFDMVQIIIAFSLSIFYAIMFEKTGSLLGPILAHNIADGWLSVLYIGIHAFVNQ